MNQTDERLKEVKTKTIEFKLHSVCYFNRIEFIILSISMTGFQINGASTNKHKNTTLERKKNHLD